MSNAWECRQDPPSKDQFGDGKYQVQWTRDLEEYEAWWQKGTMHTQQLARKLEEEGRPKSSARVSLKLAHIIESSISLTPSVS